MRPRLLDLFCGAGGCGVGYWLAGFDVVGVDITDQPRYPFEFHKADAMGFSLDGFDAIHASPPCQEYSRALSHMSGPQPRLIAPMIERLHGQSAPWVVENVVGAPLPTTSNLFGDHGVELCGTMFGLRVWRHRLFQTSFAINAPGHCDHSEAAMNPHNQSGRDRIYAEYGKQDPDPIWNGAMGVGWMTKYEGREAIPPAYTHYVGSRLLAEVKRKVAV